MLAFARASSRGGKPADTPTTAAAAAERPELGVNAKGRISTRGLVSAWRGDADASDRAGRNNGVAHGNVSFAPAMVGRGFRFSGAADDAIVVPDSPSLAISGSLTISAWVHVEAFPPIEQGAAMIVFRGDDRNGLDPYNLQVNSSGRLAFAINGVNGQGAEVTAPVPAGRFIHVAATLDGDTGRMRLFENGQIVAETSTTFGPLAELDPGANPGLGIGNHGSVPGSPFRYPFRGVINEVLLYNRALSPGEVRALYEDRADVPALLLGGPKGAP
jgi:hypothetical protein